jgi:GDP-4-dehydro-6-deoxy-D-mannose reductase
VTQDGATVLVTGGGGFVGRHLLAALAAERPGLRTVAIGREPAPRAAESRIVDLTDAGAVADAVAAVRPDAVVHLAAQSSVAAAGVERSATWDVNLGGTRHLAAAIAAHAPHASVLNVSTGEVYGASFRDGVATEDTALRPGNAYARSKAAAEWLLGDVLPVDTRLVTVRPFNHSGAGQDERFVLPAFAAQIARIEAGLAPPVLSVGNLEAERDFLDVADVVAAYLALLAAMPRLGMRETFNIASGTARPIARLLDGLVALSPAHFTVQEDPARLRPSEIAVAAGSSARLAAAIGWRPRVAMEETLRAVLDDQRRRIARG